MQRLPDLYIAHAGHKGRGVFTAHDIPAGSLIEICPLILIPGSQAPLIDRTEVYNYYFIWNEGRLALALGYGSLYNHDPAPNARVVCDYESDEIQIEAIRDIGPGEEITIHYRDEEGFKGKLWFE
jgi:SET domain-containing protein